MMINRILKLTIAAVFLLAGTSVLQAGHAIKMEFPITGSVSVIVEQTVDGPVFTMGDMDPVEMERTGEDQWIVPGLDIRLEFLREDVGGVIEAADITRYGETVRLSQDRRPQELFQDAPERVPEVLDELIPRLMIVHDVPGVSIAGIEEREVEWTGTWGVKEAGSDEQVTGETLFEAASMSKAPFAYAVLRLVDRGEFDLDKPLVDIYGEPYEKVVKDTPDDTLHKMITARMVFQHQTGFPNWSGDDPLKPAFEPGTDIGYSGEGFEFCQKVVQRVTGLPLYEFMRKELFDPLEMEQSSYIWEEHYPDISAEGHDSDGNLIEDRRIYEEPGNAAYTMYTTPSEYALFLIDVMGKTPSRGSLLSEESRKEMLDPAVHDPGRSGLPRVEEAECDDVYWGLSWRAQETSTGVRFHHGGANSTGFRCLTEFNPSTGNGIVIMTNAFGGSALRNEVFSTISLP